MQRLGLLKVEIKKRVFFVMHSISQFGRSNFYFLLGFMEANDGRRASDWTLEERKAKTIDCFTKYFGEQAKNYEAYYERNWSAEPYSRGCYGGHFTPGVWTTFGKHLRTPIGHIHWAGTESAEEWSGYMEGAVRSGERAAEEVIGKLE